MTNKERVKERVGRVMMVVLLMLLLSTVSTYNYLYRTTNPREFTNDNGIQHLIDETPPQLLEGLRAIQLKKTYPLIVLPKDREAYGLYYESGIIYIKETDGTWIRNTYWHELGHHVWNYHLGNLQRHEYEQQFYADPQLHDAEEDFAIAFALIYGKTGTYILPKDDWRYTYIADLHLPERIQ